MKKLLLISLISSISFAKINGNFEISNETFKTTYKNKGIEGRADFNTRNLSKIKTEIKMFDNSVTLGASTNLNDFKKFQDQRLWADIKFPKVKDHDIYLKAKYENLPLYGFIELESDISNFKNSLEYGFNSNLKFKVDKYKTPALTLKAFAQKDFSNFKDSRIEIEAQHRLNSVNGNLADSFFKPENPKPLGFQYISAELSTRYELSKNTQIYLESNIAYRADNNTSKYGKDVQINRESNEDHDHDHDHNHEHAGHSSGSKEDNFERGFNHIHGYKEQNTGLEAKLDRENFSELITDYHLIALKHKFKNFELLGKYKLYHRFRFNENSEEFDNIPKTTNTFTNYLGLKLKYTGFKNLTLENKSEAFYLFQDNSTTKNYTFENHSNAKYDIKLTDKFTLSPNLKTELIIDGTEYFSKDLKEAGINAGIYRDFTNKAAIIPGLEAMYKVNKNLTIKGLLGAKINFAGVWPEIYNPQFLAVDSILANIAEKNSYPLKGERFTEFLGKLEENTIKIEDDKQFKVINELYKSMMLEDLEKDNSGQGLALVYKNLLYQTKIKDPKYFGKVLPLKLNDVNVKLGLEIKYTW